MPLPALGRRLGNTSTRLDVVQQVKAAAAARGRSQGGRGAAAKADSGSDSEELLTDNDDGIYCSVCGEGDAHRRDPIVFCDGCNMTVHASCYGFPLSRAVPEGDEEWYCEVCRDVAARGGKGGKGRRGGAAGAGSGGSAGNSKRVSALAPAARCALCEKGGGALKRTTDWRWAHIACALYVPECYFHQDEGREPIDLSRVPPRRRQLKCGLCRRGGGACVSCAEPGCTQSFHVSCAQEKGAALEFREGKDGAGGITFTFCPEHTKVWREREEKRREKNERLGFKIVSGK